MEVWRAVCKFTFTDWVRSFVGIRKHPPIERWGWSASLAQRSGSSSLQSFWVTTMTRLQIFTRIPSGRLHLESAIGRTLQ
jgi:hypothetical protein